MELYRAEACRTEVKETTKRDKTSSGPRHRLNPQLRDAPCQQLSNMLSVEERRAVFSFCGPNGAVQLFSVLFNIRGNEPSLKSISSTIVLPLAFRFGMV